MSYTKTNWQDLPNTTTPINATRLNNMENGIADANGSIDVDAYSDSSTYVVGDFCIYNNKLYKCNTPILTAESFNSSHWTETNIIDEINNINNNTKTDMQTQTAKELEITDSANAIASFNKVEGDTYQATRDGKNLINIFDQVSVSSDITIDNEGWITLTADRTSETSAGYYNLFFNPNLNLQTNTSYYFVLEVKNISKVLTSSYLSIVSTQSSNKGQFANQINPTFNNLNSGDVLIFNSTTRESFSDCITFSRAFIGVVAGDNISITFRLSVLAQEPTAQTFVYEPYGVSPSPDYPSDIRNVGDNVNLFNKSTVTENRAINYNTGSASTASGYNASAFIKVKPNTKYTLDCVLYGSSSYGMAYYDNTKTYISGERINTKVVTPSNAEYFRFGVNSNSDLDTVQLKETEENLPYTPYNCGSIDFNVETKNKFVGWTRNIQTNSNNGVRTSNTNSLSSDFCEIKPSTVYRLSGLAVGSYGKNKFIAYYDINKNYISRTGSTNVSSITQTTPANAYYCTVAIAQAFDNSTILENFISDCSKIQLEKGTVITSYQEYGKQEIHFPFAAGQVLHEGDYLAEDGIHSKKKTIICQGTEGWAANGTSSSTGGKYRWRLALPDSKIYDGDVVSNTKSSHYEAVSAVQTYNAVQGIATQNRNITIYDDNYGSSTTIDWNNYLAQQYANGTPVIIEYELEEEEVTPYTTEQAEVYYKLKYFLTYEGYTIIECIDNMKPDIQVNYLYNNKVNNYYGNIIYELENRLHQLEIS